MLSDLYPLLAYLPMDRRHALATGRSLPAQTQGAALFADISGFTPLTQVLATELGHRRGAEEMTRQLNAVYTALVERVHRYGGSVISFSGDAVTCWFDGDDGARALAGATAIQEVMAAFASVQTPAGHAVSLAIKVALTTGSVRRFVVGDPSIQTIDVLAGATLDRMAAAEQQAQKGEIIVGPEAMAALAGRVPVAAWRHDAETGARYAVVDADRAASAAPAAPDAPWPPLPPSGLTAAQLEPWLLPPVYQRLRQGLGQYLAELRPAVTLFLRFTGLDFDEDDDAPAKLDAYIRWVQNVLAGHEGYLLQITVGDKGSYLYAAFGAPQAHGDDGRRAVVAAVALRQPPSEFDYIATTQIGISQGRMRTGAYGSELRLTYGVLGDAVNTAARLMSMAAPGQVLISAPVAQAAGRSYALHQLGSVPLKGKKEPLPVYVVGQRRQPSAQRPSSLYPHPLVGREADLAHMLAAARAALDGHGQVLRLEGAAGMGKSHLAAEFGEQAGQLGFRLVVGACESTTVGAPYFPWRQVFRALLDVNPGPAGAADPAAQAARQVTQVTDRLTAANPAWTLRLPLLGDLLGLPIPDNQVTASFDPRLRQEALFTLTGEILRYWTTDQPLILILEDVHWMDEASLGLAAALSRALVSMPLLLLLLQRPSPPSERSILPMLDELPHCRRLGLNELSDEGVAALVSQRLGGQPTPLTLAVIQMQAQGNPFFVEELLDALQEAGFLYRNPADDTWRLSDGMFDALRQANCLVRQQGEWMLAPNVSLSAANLGIPDSIHGLVLSRLDRLAEDEQLTLKVASVIGRSFGLALLQDAHPAQPARPALQAQIDNIVARDFVRLEVPAPQSVYLFKHSITHEVAYETLLYAQRRGLHQTVAAWYEARYGDGNLALDSALAPYYPLLAHHWRQAEVPEKERLFARLAGRQAAARFANEEAVAYLSRALELTPRSQLAARYDLVLAREAVYHLSGRRDEQAHDLVQLQALADVLDDNRVQAEVTLRYANYYEAMSDFGSAQMIAQQAVAWAEQVADPARKVEGLIAWGMALWRRGRLDEAQRLLGDALALARQHQDQSGEAMSLHHLGTVSYIKGDYAAARDYLERALSLRRALADLVGEAGSLNNLVAVYHTQSDFGRARRCCEQALAIYRTIGYQRHQATALYNLAIILHNTLGDLETAQAYLQQSLALSRTLGNKQGEADAAFNLALVLYDRGNYAEALAHSQQALTIARNIDDRVTEGFSLTALALAREGMGQWDEARAAFAAALEIRRQVGQDSYAVDDLAGLARINLRQGRTQQAVAQVEEMLAWIKDNGVHGIEYPARIYLTCADVLAAAGELDRAAVVLRAGHRWLQEQAQRIVDRDTRTAFLEQVPLHHQLQRRLEAAPPPDA